MALCPQEWLPTKKEIELVARVSWMDRRWGQYNLGLREKSNTDLNWFSDGLGMDSITPNVFGR